MIASNGVVDVPVNLFPKNFR